METKTKTSRTDKLLRVALYASAGVLFASSILAGIFASVGFGDREKKPKKTERDPNYHDFTETAEAISDIKLN